MIGILRPISVDRDSSKRLEYMLIGTKVRRQMIWMLRSAVKPLSDTCHRRRTITGKRRKI
jgi:hypothetical protein